MRRLVAIAAGLALVAAAGAGAFALWLLRWEPYQNLTPAELTRLFTDPLPRAPAGPAAKGRALVAAAGCARCHQADLAGGTELVGPFGFVRSANLTPNITGLLHETEGDLVTTLRSGLNEDGEALPNRAMPWDQLGHLSPDELRDLIAYLKVLPSVQRGTAHLLPNPRTPAEVHIPLGPLSGAVGAPRGP
jgi:mono/diheme cytochrome c family protein